jgi:hypothetical protein
MGEGIFENTETLFRDNRTTGQQDNRTTDHGPRIWEKLGVRHQILTGSENGEPTR